MRNTHGGRTQAHNMWGGWTKDALSSARSSVLKRPECKPAGQAVTVRNAKEASFAVVYSRSDSFVTPENNADNRTHATSGSDSRILKVKGAIFGDFKGVTATSTGCILHCSVFYSLSSPILGMPASYSGLRTRTWVHRPPSSSLVGRSVRAPAMSRFRSRIPNESAAMKTSRW